MSAAPHDGVAVTIGGVNRVLAPMLAPTARRLWDRIKAMQSGSMDLPDQLELTIDMVHACLQRNHPDLSREAVEQHVDVGNYDELGAMCFGRGAWLRWVEVQAQLSGNVPPPPVKTGADGRGDSSTPASPPPPAGGSETSTS